ncbi:adhesive plaque matrix protein [Hermetia illucens]|nr:adhesive plaque matrix protein [Hermetia illucens]
MKSFALHLVVVFILGAEYQLQTFCLSPSSSSATASSPASTTASSSPFRERFIASGPRSSPSSSETTQHRKDAKTSRTIQRLVAGHLQFSNNNSSNQWSNAIFRRRPNITKTQFTPTRSTFLRRVKSTATPSVASNDELDYRDSALLEDTNDIGNWDDGILRLSAGAGKETNAKGKKKQDSKKTLADQVKDGKYGLIENELFKNVPKRPGIISYLPNKEVPDDNAKNYGGLKEDDIWLAEDHLLVLKGGGLNEDDIDEPWAPIDDYEAPGRQIKIPPNPKVPPPFPVQFEDNGPIQFIGDHKFPFFYSKNENKSLSLFPENGYQPTEADRNNEKDILAGPGSSQNATSDKDRYLYPPAYPPWLFNNESFKNPFLNFAPPPQDAPPFDGGTDYIDEDDPSLYYPPPYTFVYKSNYSNPVKPGPLVPGIVLPPPPNAFARLVPKKQHTPSKTVPFTSILNKINEERPRVVTTTTTTTTELTTTPYITTTQPPPPSRTKEVYYVRPRTRPYSVPLTSPLPPATTTTTTPIPPTQQIISFVPQTQTPTDSFSTGKPIYYEYFDARKVPTGAGVFQAPQTQTQGAFFPQITRTNAAFPTTTQRPIPSSPKPYIPQKTFPKPIFRETTQPFRRPVPTVQTQKPLRINPISSAPKPYNYNDYLYITPKPEIYPNGISTNIIPQTPQRPFKLQSSFDREVDAIRQTLQYFKSQEVKQGHFSRNPRPKALYEYNFDGSGPGTGNYNPSGAFTPPSNYDSEPFKPMVQYSRPVNDANGFKAIAYPRTDSLATNQGQNIYYSSTPRTEPLQIEVQFGDNLNNRPSLFNSPQPTASTPRDQRKFNGRIAQPSSQYLPQQSTARPRQPWVSIEKQVVHEIIPQNDPVPFRSSNQNNINRSITGFIRNAPRNQQPVPPFQGYYYTQPAQQRPNHRFQQFPEPSFPKQVGEIQTQLNQYRVQQQQQPVSLENDTFVNTFPSQTINPDAEYINLPPRREQFQQQRLPPLSSPQQEPGSNIYRKPVDIEGDILVNYKLPLPPINPDSELIQPQFGNRDPQQQQQFFQRPQSGFPQYNGASRPFPNNNRPPNFYYVTPQRDLRFKGV